MGIPTVQTGDRNQNQLQQYLQGPLNKLLANPLLNGVLLLGDGTANSPGIFLKAGMTNIVNHTLGRNLIGWIVTTSRAAAVIYDTQELNTTPNLNLQLITSADVLVQLYVF